MKNKRSRPEGKGPIFIIDGVSVGTFIHRLFLHLHAVSRKSTGDAAAILCYDWAPLQRTCGIDSSCLTSDSSQISNITLILRGLERLCVDEMNTE